MLDGTTRPESGRGAGRLSPEGDRVNLQLRSDRKEDLVEGYVTFEDEGLASQVRAVVLVGVGKAMHHDSLFAREIALGSGLTIEEDGVLHWQVEGLRPSNYVLRLQPLGIYCTVKVESTALGMQTLLSEVPRLVMVGVNLLDTDETLVTSARSISYTAFVAGNPTSRPTATFPVTIEAAEGSPGTVLFAIPEGSYCFVDVCAGVQSGRGRFEAHAGVTHNIELQPKMRWLNLQRSPVGECAPVPLQWWEENIRTIDKSGQPQPVICNFQTKAGIVDRDEITPWGTTIPLPLTTEMEIAVPEGPGALLVRGAWSETGDERIEYGAGDGVVEIGWPERR